MERPEAQQDPPPAASEAVPADIIDFSARATAPPTEPPIAAAASNSSSRTELTRERESYKYFNLSTIPTVLEHIPSSHPLLQNQASPDKALTAFAQLGAFRLNCRRALISLFDQRYQYVVAEATRTLPLQSDTNLVGEDQLWLSGAAIPRSYGICDSVLGLNEEHAKSRHARAATPPVVSIISDLSQDKRYQDKEYVTGWPNHRFYAGVPIRTPSGIDIGVYCVYDDAPRDPLDAASQQFLRDIAATVMEHFEATRSRRQYHRSERMVRGLGSFIEGRATIVGWGESGKTSFSDDGFLQEGTLDARQQHIAKDIETRAAMETDGFQATAPQTEAPLSTSPAPPVQSPPVLAPSGLATPDLLFSDGGRPASPARSGISSLMGSRPSASKSGSTTLSSGLPLGVGTGSTAGSSRLVQSSDTMSLSSMMVNGSSTDTGSLRQTNTTTSLWHPATELTSLFSRAANLLREAIEVEGVVFFDANVGSFGGLTQNDHLDTSSSSETGSAHSYSSNEDLKMPPAQSAPEPSRRCKVLGFAMSDMSSINGESILSGRHLLFEHELKTLLRRHPNGKIYSFADARLLSSDTDDSAGAEHSSTAADDDAAAAANVASKRRHKIKVYSRQEEGQLIINVFPGANSVVMFPLWDSHRERWFAGGLAWTHRPSRVFTTADDLSYLLAFGASMMADVARVDAMLSDRAKADVLGSISHELRSPLHGILGGVDTLYGTSMNSIQSDIAHSIETCGVTLLDTVNHLLDYAKINNSMRRTRKPTDPNRTGKQYRKKSSRSRANYGATHVSTVVDVAVLCEEVVESVYSGYIFQNLPAESQNRSEAMSATMMYGKDDLRGAEITHSSSRSSSPIVGPPLLSDIKILLDIDAAQDWRFMVEPGSLRRIVMNIFGNALKYTAQGFVKVTLRQQKPLGDTNNSPFSTVLIVVTDSGKGISEDYLNSHVYTPFSQENSLAPGVGLGLSITRQIILSMQGTIGIQSQVGKGTTVSVSLPLLDAKSSPETSIVDYESRFAKFIQRLTALRVYMYGFGNDSALTLRDVKGEIANWKLPRSLLEDICREWLHMDVLAEDNVRTIVPDLYLTTETAALELVRSNKSEGILQPVVVLCRSIKSANQLSETIKGLDATCTFEFVSLPWGPQKLAKIFVLCLDRWTERQVARTTANSPTGNSPAAISPTVQPENSPSAELSDPILAASPQPLTQNEESAQSSESPSAAQEVSSTPVIDDPMALDPQPSDDAPAFLVVDDNHVNLKLLVTYMKRKNCRYSTAMNGLEAVKLYKEARGGFRAVLLDLSMPVMDGLTATRHIRGFEKKEGLPPTEIIALTGHSSADTQNDAFASGIDKFLTKPVRLKELDRLLRL